MEEFTSGGINVGHQLKKLFDDTLNIQINTGDSLIAPRYHHDRAERSVQMRLYTISKQQFAVVFFVFFTALSLFIFIGLAGPPITSVVRRPFSKDLNFNQTDLSKGPFRIHSPLLSAYCQQLWIIAEILTDEDQGLGAAYQSRFNVSVDIHPVTHAGKQENTIATGNRTHKLSCKGTTCSEFVLAHLGHLPYKRYTFTITFYGLKGFYDKFGISNINFYFKSYNPTFSHLEIWVRFLFVAIAFGFSVWFFQALKPYSYLYWAMEQQWMAILLPLLLLYDNPVFPLVFLSDGSFGSVADGLFQATFLCALMLFWLCIYHGIRENSRTMLKFYLPKLVLIGLLWLSVVVLTIWDRFNDVRDPSWYSNDVNTGHFNGFKGFFYTIGVVYVVYLVFLVTRAYGELRNLPYFDVRLKFFTGLMLLVVVAVVVLSGLKFGVAPSVEDNFVSQLSTTYSSSAHFMASYALLNFYLFTMAFVYSPSPTAATEFLFKGDPEDTLLNDSEDELLYNSSEFTDELTKLGQDDESD